MKILSFITTIYNVEWKFLNDLFMSFEELTEDPRLEFVIVDDNSLNNSAYEKLFNKFSNNNNFKFLKLDKNTKRTGAFTEGINMSTGKYIASLDSDDLINKLALQNVLLILSEIQHDFILNDTFVFDYQNHLTYTEKIYNGKTKSEICNDPSKFIKWPTFTAYNTLVKGEVARLIKYKTDIIKAPHDDAYFTQEWMYHSNSSFYISEPFFRYTINQPWTTFSGPNSMKTKSQVENHWLLAKSIIAMYKKNNPLTIVNITSILSSHFKILKNRSPISLIIFYFKLKMILPLSLRRSKFYKKSWFKKNAKSGIRIIGK